MSYYEKYLKYKYKYLDLQKQMGGGIVVGDRVRELDSLMTGVVIEIHDKWEYTHIVMKGDDGKMYDHNTHHYVKLSDESNYVREQIKSKLQQRAQEETERKMRERMAGRLFEIGDKVRERDSLTTGVVVEVHNKYGVTHVVMKGDDGKKYDHNIYHYQLLEYEDKDDIQLRIKEKEEKKEEERLRDIEWRKNSNTLYIGDRVMEYDSSMTGVITEFHNKYGFTHAIMKGDDNKIYDYNLSHYKKIKST